MGTLMLWNPESECWYSVDPQSIPEDRSFLIFCETCQIEKANPSESVPSYSECGVSIGIPRRLDTLCPKCRELISLVSGS